MYKERQGKRWKKKEQHTFPKQGFLLRNDVSFLTPGSRNDSKNMQFYVSGPRLSYEQIVESLLKTKDESESESLFKR